MCETIWGSFGRFLRGVGRCCGGFLKGKLATKEDKLPKPYLLLSPYLALGSLFTEWGVGRNRISRQGP